jgi:hypothetical protein
MVKVEVAEAEEEDAYWRGRTRTETNSHAETLPKNLIARLPMQNLNGRGFRGLLSRTAVHAFARMGKIREQHNKRNLVARDIERTHMF